MKIKFIQINIYRGKYLESLVDFLKKEDADFISMQEVTTNGFNLYQDRHVSLFDVLKNRLKMHGAFWGDLKLRGDSSSVFGNAVFSKYKIVAKKVVILKKFRPVTIEELDAGRGELRGQIPRHLLDARVQYLGRALHILSWHGAWTAPPSDTPETLRQAKIAADYLKSLKESFILGGDLNNVIGSKILDLINKVAKNWMVGSDIGRTTHPTAHKIAPRGFLVDYIFTSQNFKLLKFQVPDVLVSDHLPVVAEFEF